MFGKMNNPAPGPLALLPGVVTGFGGGTWNLDGSQATPPDQVDEPRPLPPLAQRSGIFGPRQPMRTPIDPISNTPPRPLGGSMRQPFDYDGAMARMMPAEHKMSALQKIAAVLGPALMAASGNQQGANNFTQMLAQRRQQTAQQRAAAMAKLEDWKHDDWSRQNGADLNAAAPFTIGRDRLAYDPATGETDTLYHGTADFQDYAQQQGFQPGTPEYNGAMADYVLRANGPTALAGDRELEGLRTDNRAKLEAIRQGNRMQVRNTPAYRDTHPAPARMTAPRRATSARPTAVGPTGERVEWDGKAWVPVK